MSTVLGTYGLMAEFKTPAELVSAMHQTRSAGYTKVDAFSPFPIEELSEAMDLGRGRLPLLVLIGGIIGGLAGFALQYWVAVIAYPLNIGGKPFNSWPAFIPVTFETTVLFAALTAVFGMFALNGLPMPYHPVFNAPRFALATRDRFFLLIESEDPMFDADDTARFLQRFQPRQVSEVEP